MTSLPLRDVDGPMDKIHERRVFRYDPRMAPSESTIASYKTALERKLDLTMTPLIGDDLLRGGCDDRVTKKQIEYAVFREKLTHRPNRHDAREPSMSRTSSGRLACNKVRENHEP